MLTVYFISGLGADERVFKKLDFTGINPIFIKWVTPYENETIENYVSRLKSQIVTEKPIVVGLSFGGLIAIELAKQIKTDKVILISSIKNKYEIPKIYKAFGLINLHRFLPLFVLKNVNFITYFLFGVKTDKEKKILHQTIKETDFVFLKWAINALLKWKNTQNLPNLIKIHGTDDKLLPYYKNADFLIKNGGHLMILNKNKEINAVLKSILF